MFYLCVGVLYAQQVATVKGRISAGEEPIVGAVVQLKELKGIFLYWYLIEKRLIHSP